MLEQGGLIGRKKILYQKGDSPWTKDVFTERLKDVGRSFYHDKHPFHLAMQVGS